MNRILIVGTSCSGKTTLAKKIAQKLKIKHTTLDDLYWLPNWQPQETENFEAAVKNFIADDQWILDGNYKKSQLITRQKADTLIWLNYPHYLIFYRALKRTFKRVFTKQKVCNGNIETFKIAFLSKESILLWVLTSHRSNKKAYNKLIKQNDYPHLNIIKLNSPKQTQQFLDALSPQKSPPKT